MVAADACDVTLSLRAVPPGRLGLAVAIRPRRMRVPGARRSSLTPAEARLLQPRLDLVSAVLPEERSAMIGDYLELRRSPLAGQAHGDNPLVAVRPRPVGRLERHGRRMLQVSQHGINRIAQPRGGASAGAHAPRLPSAGAISESEATSSLRVPAACAAVAPREGRRKIWEQPSAKKTLTCPLCATSSSSSQLVATVNAPVSRQAQARATDNHDHRDSDVAGQCGAKDG